MPPVEQMTITAALMEDGEPVLDANVTAIVIHPDETTATEVVLHDDGANGDATTGDGVYTGLVTATTRAGFYTILVTATHPDPGFTHEQALNAFVSQSGTVLSGSIADHGVDTDGDGLYDQLVIDVGVTVDVAGAYRVFGTLTDGDGTTIEQVRAEQELAPGLRNRSRSPSTAQRCSRSATTRRPDRRHRAGRSCLGHGSGPRRNVHDRCLRAYRGFQRPPCVLTGNATDRGEHTDSQGQMPFEALVVEVEADLLTGAGVRAHANLYAADGTFVASCRTSAVLPAMYRSAPSHFDSPRSGSSGAARLAVPPLRPVRLWGSAVSLHASRDGRRPRRITGGLRRTAHRGRHSTPAWSARDWYPRGSAVPSDHARQRSVYVSASNGDWRSIWREHRHAAEQSAAGLHDRQTQRHDGGCGRHEHRRELHRRPRRTMRSTPLSPAAASSRPVCPAVPSAIRPQERRRDRPSGQAAAHEVPGTDSSMDRELWHQWRWRGGRAVQRRRARCGAGPRDPARRQDRCGRFHARRREQQLRRGTIRTEWRAGPDFRHERKGRT